MTTLVFLHIDKTGGTSLYDMLASHFTKPEIMPVPRHPERGKAAYPVADPDLHAANRLFSQRIRAAHRLVMGHYDWGVVQYIPNPFVITVLRDPVERFASLYRYICQRPKQYGVLSRQARKMGAAWFAHHHTHLYAEAMTRQLAGARWTANAPADEAMYQTALQNLRRCDVVMTTANLNASAGALALRLGWQPAELPVTNTTEPTPITNKAIAIAEQHMVYDQRLFNQAERIEDGLQQSIISA